jgi:hypothetical protein
MKRLTSWGVSYAAAMTIACAISYAVITEVLPRSVDEPTELLGGMWAVVATVFVFRESRPRSLGAGLARLVATRQFLAVPCLSTNFPFHGLGHVPS